VDTRLLRNAESAATVDINRAFMSKNRAVFSGYRAALRWVLAAANTAENESTPPQPPSGWKSWDGKKSWPGDAVLDAWKK
jgi:hypothetical protein